MSRKGIIKHKKVFDEWIKGAIVQHKGKLPEWNDCTGNEPLWHEEAEYRVKPEPLLRPFTPEEILARLGQKYEDKENYRPCQLFAIRVSPTGGHAVEIEHPTHMGYIVLTPEELCEKYKDAGMPI